MRLFVATFCSALTFFIVIFVVLFVKRTQSLNVFHRLRRHSVAKSSVRNKEREPLLGRIYKLIKQVAKPFSAWEISRNLDFKLRQAGVPLYGAEFIVISIIFAIIGALVFYIIVTNIIAVILAGLTALVSMWALLSILVKRRRGTFTEQLGDCLTTIANALRAGYSFQQAMDIVAKEMEPPISLEFERVMTDIAIGVSLEEALDQMSKRVGSNDFDLVVTAVLVQREVGGNLAQILDTISDTINERVRMKREINSLTAQGRFSSWVLILLPIATAFFCWTTAPERMQVFFEEEAGHYAVAFAIITELLGLVTIQRMVDIEV